MFTTASRRASRARRSRRAIPCIAVTVTLGNLAQRWVAQRTDSIYPPCTAVAEHRSMPAPGDELVVQRSNAGGTGYVVRPPAPQAPPAGSGATSSTSVTSR
jgi:hypothetical protein